MRLQPPRKCRQDQPSRWPLSGSFNLGERGRRARGATSGKHPRGSRGLSRSRPGSQEHPLGTGELVGCLWGCGAATATVSLFLSEPPGWYRVEQPLDLTGQASHEGPRGVGTGGPGPDLLVDRVGATALLSSEVLLDDQPEVRLVPQFPLESSLTSCWWYLPYFLHLTRCLCKQ